MKKSIIFSLGLSALSVAALASCGGGKSSNAIETKGSWGAQEVKNNIDAEDEIVAPVTSREYDSAANYRLLSTKISNANYASKGLIVTENAYGNIGFYSLLHDKYLLYSSFSKKVLTYSVQDDQNVGYFLKIVYDDKVYWYDSLGNIVEEDDENKSSILISSTIINNNVYLIKIVDGKTEYMQYLNDGKLETIASLPQQQATDNNTTTSSFAKNSKYVDINKLDLKKYGFKEGYLSFNGELVTLFNDDNKPQSTFTVPNGSVMMFVGSQLFYQNEYEASENENNYSYYSNGVKKIVETYVIDLVKGDKKQVELDYKINQVIGPYMDSKGVYNSTLILKQSFSNHILKAQDAVLVNSDGAVISNLNGYKPESFIMIGNNFYNTETKVLYDSSLQEIAYLGAINPTYYEKEKCFIGSIKGLYGVLDSSGVVKIPFEYSTLYYQNTVDGYVFGIKNNHLYRINLATGVESDLGSNYFKYNNYIYLTKTDDNYKIEYAKSSIGSPIKANSYQQVGSVDSPLFNSNILRFDSTSDYINSQTQTYDEYRQYINLSYKKVPNYSTFESIGTELYHEQRLGETMDDYQSLNLGENKMYITSYSGNYFRYVPTEDGWFNLDNKYKDQNVTVNVSVYDSSSLTNYSQVQVNNETYGNVVLLEKNKTYFFKISSNYTSKGTIYLNFKKEAGEHIKYPVLINPEEDNVLNVYKDGTYAAILADGKGYYELNNPTGFTSGFQSSISTINIPNNYQFVSSPNSTTKNDHKYYYFGEYSASVVRIVAPSSYDKPTFTFNATFVDDEELNPIGLSIANPYVLDNVSNLVYIANGSYNYYVYRNKTNSRVKLTSSLTNFFSEPNSSSSSLVSIYRKKYEPGLTPISDFVNGGSIYLNTNDEIWIRTKSTNNTNARFNIYVEGFNQATTSSINNSVSGTSQTYYYQPTSSGLYRVELSGGSGNTLIGYDSYGFTIYSNKTTATSGPIYYNKYMYAGSVYKIEVEKSSSTNSCYLKVLSTSSYDNQYITPLNETDIYYYSNYTKMNYESVYSTTYYITTMYNGTYYSPTYTVVDKETNSSVTVKTGTVNGITYSYFDLVNGKEYIISAGYHSTLSGRVVKVDLRNTSLEIVTPSSNFSYVQARNIKNDKYESTNTSSSSTGNLNVSVLESGTLSFNYNLSCGANDSMRITRTRNGSSTIIETISGSNSGNYQLDVEAFDLITITYARSSSSSANDNKLVIDGFKFTELSA